MPDLNGLNAISATYGLNKATEVRALVRWG